MTKSLVMKSKSHKSEKENIRNFQRKLYLKAKQENSFKFYSLYDKVSRKDILREAYKRVKRNAGVAGVDGKTFGDIEKDGTEEFINNIHKDLLDSRYIPQPVLRVYIPKANGKLRPLGIPTIKDRTIQMACKIVIEPVFEADFENTSFGFRPKKSAKDAIKQINENLKAGCTHILDADLSGYFDTIPHDKLMRVIEERITDRRVLHLFKKWLRAPVKEEGRISGGKRNKCGTPQGGVISPLLSNIYLHLFDRTINNPEGAFFKTNIRIVRYADDFVIMGKEIPTAAYQRIRNILEKMELKLNEEKTKMVDARKESFDFLGFTFSNGYNKKYNNHWNINPSKKSRKKIRSIIKDVLNRYRNISAKELASKLNPKIRGWVNYFNIEGLNRPFRVVDSLFYYLGIKLQWYFKRKSQRKSRLCNQKAIKVLWNKYSLVKPRQLLLS